MAQKKKRTPKKKKSNVDPLNNPNLTAIEKIKLKQQLDTEFENSELKPPRLQVIHDDTEPKLQAPPKLIIPEDDDNEDRPPKLRVPVEQDDSIQNIVNLVQEKLGDKEQLKKMYKERMKKIRNSKHATIIRQGDKMMIHKENPYDNQFSQGGEFDLTNTDALMKKLTENPEEIDRFIKATGLPKEHFTNAIKKQLDNQDLVNNLSTKIANQNNLNMDETVMPTPDQMLRDLEQLRKDKTKK